MGEIENLPDGKAKEFLKKLSTAATVEDIRAVRLMIRQTFPEVSDEREELLAYAEERLTELKKPELARGTRGKAREVR